MSEEWSLHAEFVVRRGNKQQQPATRMEYSWAPGSSSVFETRPVYGFQRGNIVFTTSPPQCGINKITNNNNQTLPRYRSTADKLGYSYEPRLTRSPTVVSNKFNTMPTAGRTYDRRCRSTCSITLQCDIPSPHEKVTRTQSLRTSSGSECLVCGKLKSLVPDSETCPDCRYSKRTERAHTFTTHFCTHVVNDEEEDKNSKDASSQTGDEESRQKIPEIVTPAQENHDRARKLKPRKKLSRSPARVRGKSPLLRDKTAREDGLTTTGEAKKQPRTVHIDVYCTGSENADDSGSSEDECEVKKPARTVYEGKDMRVTHQRMREEDVPYRRRQGSAATSTVHETEDVRVGEVRQNNTAGSTVHEQEDMRVTHQRIREEDVPYRRRQDYADTSTVHKTEDVRVGELDGACSRRQNNTADSTVHEQEDTRVGEVDGPYRRRENTTSSTISDSQTDISSAYPSLTSSAATLADSTTSMLTTTTSTTTDYSLSSAASLTQNDSFEYADSSDRQRIKQMEEKWSTVSGGQKHTEQRRKLQEYLLSRDSFPSWRSSSTEQDSCTTSDSDSEMGWTFSRPADDDTSDNSSLKREDTVKRRADPHRYTRPAVLGPFGVKPESPPPPKLDNTDNVPFTETRGPTDCFSKAEKFGAIVKNFKKPGHHVGPAKNPDCTCENCQRYYSERKNKLIPGYTGRSSAESIDLTDLV